MIDASGSDIGTALEQTDGLSNGVATRAITLEWMIRVRAWQQMPTLRLETSARWSSGMVLDPCQLSRPGWPAWCCRSLNVMRPELAAHGTAKKKVESTRFTQEKRWKRSNWHGVILNGLAWSLSFSSSPRLPGFPPSRAELFHAIQTRHGRCVTLALVSLRENSGRNGGGRRCLARLLSRIFQPHHPLTGAWACQTKGARILHFACCPRSPSMCDQPACQSLTTWFPTATTLPFCSNHRIRPTDP